MPDDPYSLADLARLADVTPRTIRYYVAQGLLRSPAAAGPSTRYTEGHLLRLRLIKRLQRDHLPLSEIRARLERLADTDVATALEATSGADAAPEQGAQATVAFVRELMAKASIAPRFHDEPIAPPATPASPAPMMVRRALAMEAAPMHMEMPILSAPSTPAPSQTFAPTTSTGDRSTWERVSLSPDVELHIRRPLDRSTNKRIEKLIELALDLFRDGP